VHGGSGGVGTAAIHLCKAAGVPLIVTTGSAPKADYCRRQGATHVINYTTGSFRDAVHTLTEGRGVNVLLDCVGAAYLNDNLRCLAPDGALVVIGLMGGAKEELNLGRLLQKRIKLIGSTLRSLPTERKAALVQSFAARFGDELASGALLPEVFEIVDLQDAAQAHKIMKKGLHEGKIVMQVPR
jgi:NADPH:quinone reductase-like Zn-dependent oxidoreductase